MCCQIYLIVSDRAVKMAFLLQRIEAGRKQTIFNANRFKLGDVAFCKCPRRNRILIGAVWRTFCILPKIGTGGGRTVFTSSRTKIGTVGIALVRTKRRTVTAGSGFGRINAKGVVVVHLPQRQGLAASHCRFYMHRPMCCHTTDVSFLWAL